MEAYTGEIRPFGGKTPPAGWMLCQGQQLKINQYGALFTLLGTTYGGDGTTSFNLPNLASRVVVGQGQLRGGGLYEMGQPLGAETVPLSSPQLPAHAHAATGSVGTVDGQEPPTASPVQAAFAAGGVGAYDTTTGAEPGTLGDGAVTGFSGPAGTGQPHANVQPVLGLNFIICLEGIFPSQPG